MGALIEYNTVKRTGIPTSLKSAAVEVNNSSGVVINQLTVQDPCFASDLLLGSQLEPGEQGIKFDPAGLRVKDQRK